MKNNIDKIVHYLANQGLKALRDSTGENIGVSIDYISIFSKDQKEFDELNKLAKTLGEEVDKETAKTGQTYLLKEPIQTAAGILKLVKIRLPDPTRPQRGAPDFKISNYQEFKDKYLRKSGNFTLMLRDNFEMIEVKGVDVLVYLPDKTLGERI